MAKKPTISTLVGGWASAARLNTILQQILDAFDNTLSRDGSTPNQMQADLDLNNNNLLNINELTADNLRIAGVKLVEAKSVPSWLGEWSTSKTYAANDLIRYDGQVYICLESHTSFNFSTDLTANKWQLFVAKGSPGDGTGDMIGSNNLSDISSVPAARANLELGNLATITVPAFILTLLDDVDAATARLTLGLGSLATKSSVGISDIASSAKSGADDKLITGTPGTNGQYAQWNTDGDIIGVAAPSSGISGSANSRSAGHFTAYQNTQGKPIACSIAPAINGNSTLTVQISPNNSTWYTVASLRNFSAEPVILAAQWIVPDTWYYRQATGNTQTVIEIY